MMQAPKANCGDNLTLNNTVEINDATTTPIPIASPFKTLSIVAEEKLVYRAEQDRNIVPSRGRKLTCPLHNRSHQQSAACLKDNKNPIEPKEHKSKE